MSKEGLETSVAGPHNWPEANVPGTGPKSVLLSFRARSVRSYIASYRPHIPLDITHDVDHHHSVGVSRRRISGPRRRIKVRRGDGSTWCA